MKKSFSFYIALLISSTFFVAEVHAEPAKQLLASIPPIASLMKELAGDLVEVNSLVSTTDNAELFEPTPKQLFQFSKTRLYFTTGLPFEGKWLETIKQNYPAVSIVVCCDDLQQHHHEGHSDPHIWTDPIVTLEISKRMAKVLIELYPDAKTEIQFRLENIQQQLMAMDYQIQQDVQSIKTPVFFVAHPAWSYFAERYGLQQNAIEQDGKDIGIHSRVQLIRHAQENNIKKIFTQSQVNPKSAQLFADEINAKVIELNPLAENHIQNLQKMSQLIIGSMK